jgi:GAF domain-containing protein
LIGSRVAELLQPTFCVAYLRAGDAWRPVYCLDLEHPPVFEGRQSDEVAQLLDNRVVPLRFRTSSADNDGLNAWLDGLDARLVVPLHFKSGGHGFLCLGDKRSRDVYTQTDVSLLTAVAVQAS